ncbi:MAG: UPF0149 family protein [Gammaproteobacteria bacterium]|jgi:uncharacterized protein YgfB (UPF0149 family)
MPTSPAYAELADALKRIGAASEAAECHGTLVGMLSAGGGDNRESWIAQTLGEGMDPGNALVQECRRELVRLHDATRSALLDPGMGFRPLLPDDRRALAVRTAALGHWVQGFLFGLTLAGFKLGTGQSPEVREILADFAEIARAGLEGEEASEEDEQAYAEIVEYLRVGAQLMHDELNPVTGDEHLAPPGLH